MGDEPILDPGVQPLLAAITDALDFKDEVVSVLRAAHDTTDDDDSGDDEDDEVDDSLPSFEIAPLNNVLDLERLTQDADEFDISVYWKRRK